MHFLNFIYPLIKASDTGPEAVAGERGSYCQKTGKFVRAAASRAIRDIRSLAASRQQNSFLQELAQGTAAFRSLVQQFPHLHQVTGPMLARSEASWGAGPSLYTWSQGGCPRLRQLDLWATSHPRSMITRSGELRTGLGVTKQGVLAAALLLPRLTLLKYNDLGDILQLYEHVHRTAQQPPPSLGLTHFSESRLTLDKLAAARQLCPGLASLDISMFNFSFFDPEASASVAGDVMNRFSESSKLLFQFSKLRDLEIQYMDDSRMFLQCVQDSASRLTRLCLSKMISISFETLAAIKQVCRQLEVLDVYVDQVFTFRAHTPLEQAVAEAATTDWPTLRSLKLGGSIPTPSILQHLLHGATGLRVLCYSLYEEARDSVTDEFVQQLFSSSPMPELTAFYCEKSELSPATFYYLAAQLPRLRCVGVLSEWGGLDRAGEEAIKAHILSNNLNIDIESLQD